jgi:hypothetical protein
MQEHRNNHRRENERTYVFPQYHGNGEVFEKDRRNIPDRRLNDISVEELTCEEIILEISKIN